MRIVSYDDPRLPDGIPSGGTPWPEHLLVCEGLSVRTSRPRKLTQMLWSVLSVAVSAILALFGASTNRLPESQAHVLTLLGGGLAVAFACHLLFTAATFKRVTRYLSVRQDRRQLDFDRENFTLERDEILAIVAVSSRKVFDPAGVGLRSAHDGEVASVLVACRDLGFVVAATGLMPDFAAAVAEWAGSALDVPALRHELCSQSGPEAWRSTVAGLPTGNVPPATAQTLSRHAGAASPSDW